MASKNEDSFASQQKRRQWSRGDYTIFTDPKKVPVDRLNAAFASEDMYWAKELPESDMREMLENSLNFSVFYHGERRSQGVGEVNDAANFVGFARCITDFTTFLYLTDVYIWPSHAGAGLGTWLVNCVEEVVQSMPYLRRSMLLTGSWDRSVPFYEKLMGMHVVDFKRGADGRSGEGLAVMTKLGPGCSDSTKKAP